MELVAVHPARPVTVVPMPPGLKYLLSVRGTIIESEALAVLNSCSKEFGDCELCPVRRTCDEFYFQKVDDARIKWELTDNVRRFIK